MKISSFSPVFNSTDFNVAYYHGKDFVHTGFLLELNPKKSWQKISYTARKQIQKRGKLKNLIIKQVEGTPHNLQQFRKMWFDANDPTIPSKLQRNEILYFAHLDNKLVGGMILTPSGGNNLFLHNLASTPEGKKIQLPSLLLWHAVETLSSSKYRFIDIGVSYRQNLYRFFKHWNTASYPVIFEPPFIKPSITLSPFTASHLTVGNQSHSPRALTPFFPENSTFFPRGMFAIKALLSHYGLNKTDNVAIFKTFNDNDYISRCVTSTIEAVCSWQRKITKRTKLVFVIHEFGYPYTELKTLKKECDALHLPLVEDCAWGYGSVNDQGDEMGKIGTHAIYSFAKILPIQYGSIVTNIKISDEDMWTTHQMLDVYKREYVMGLVASLGSSLQKANKKKRLHWHYLHKFFSRDGFSTFAPLTSYTYPSAYLLELPSTAHMQELFQRFASFGIETGRYYPNNAIFIPIHQNLTYDHLNYMYAVFRGYLNLCSHFHRQ